MARATDADVRALVEMLASVSTTPFITAAAVVSDSLLAGKGLSEELLTQIEIYMAAHFAVLAVEKGGLIKDTRGVSSATYNQASNRLVGFASTKFGQMAMTMDSTGTLTDAQPGSRNAQFRVVSGENANPDADSYIG